MNDLYLVFLAGLLGSAHCIGMCGAFVLAISATGDRRSGIAHQSVYFLGKTITYSILGAIAGGIGSALTGLTGLQNTLSIVAGVLMVFIGLGLVGILSRIEGIGRFAGVSAFQKAMGYFLRRHSYTGSLGLGLLNGILPCGLVYGLLVKAASTGTVIEGAATMFVFGIATIPALFILGLSGHLARPAWRNRLNLASGVFVIVLGLLTVLRGTPYMKDFMSIFPMGHSGHEQVDQPMPANHQHHSMH